MIRGLRAILVLCLVLLATGALAQTGPYPRCEYSLPPQANTSPANTIVYFLAGSGQDTTHTAANRQEVHDFTVVNKNTSGYLIIRLWSSKTLGYDGTFSAAYADDFQNFWIPAGTTMTWKNFDVIGWNITNGTPGGNVYIYAGNGGN